MWRLSCSRPAETGKIHPNTNGLSPTHAWTDTKSKGLLDTENIFSVPLNTYTGQLVCSPLELWKRWTRKMWCNMRWEFFHDIKVCVWNLEQTEIKVSFFYRGSCLYQRSCNIFYTAPEIKTISSYKKWCYLSLYIYSFSPLSRQISWNCTIHVYPPQLIGMIHDFVLTDI